MTRIRTSPTMRQKPLARCVTRSKVQCKIAKKQRRHLFPSKFLSSSSTPDKIQSPARVRVSFSFRLTLRRKRKEKIVMLLSKRDAWFYQGECGFRVENDTCTRVWSRLVKACGNGRRSRYAATRYSVRGDLRLKHTRSTIKSFPWH